jgi:capsular polysaccharide biosynthesis protein
MRWNLAIAVLLGVMLAMAMAFGGQIMHGPVVSPPP